MSKIAELSARFGDCRHISFSEGPNELVFLSVNNRGGGLKVSLYGGQILTAQLGGELLWLSTESKYEKGIAIRGGVPIVFPWFGGHFDDAGLPAHGFARISDWELSRVEEGEAATTLTLSLTENAQTLKLWPYQFRLEQRITLGEGLFQSLEVHNTDLKSWSFAAGFHPYFRISNLKSTYVKGLENKRYVNLLDRSEHREPGAIAFGSELDRAYYALGEDIRIEDRGKHREIGVFCDDCDSVVVWNPGVGRPKSHMPNAGPDEFICVEPSIAGTAKGMKQYRVLMPGESTSFSYEADISQIYEWDSERGF